MSELVHKTAEPSLELFFKPRSVAIIGLSRAALNSPVSVLTTLQDFGYGGRIYIINPKMADSGDHRAYASLDDVPSPVDLAVVSVARDQVLEVLRACVRTGIRAAIVITQGFADADDEGRRLQGEMVALARAGGIRILGPNTIGVANALENFTSSFIEIYNDRTPVAVISQSGLFLMGHNLINNEPAGFCMAADLGNASDVSLVELLSYLGGLDEIRVIQCHVEGITQGRAFIETASEIGRQKPIVLLKAGRSEAGRVAVESHSGVAAGEDQVYRAAFRKAGIIEARDAEELRLLSKAFVTYRPPRGRRVAVLSYSGGGAILAIDALEAWGLELAEFSSKTKESLADLFPSWISLENPLDCWIPVSKDLHGAFPRMLETILRDDGVDAVLCIYCSYNLPKYDAYDCTAYIASLSEKYPDKPVLCWSYGIDIAGFTRTIEASGTAMVFPSLGAAAGTLAKMADFEDNRRRPSALSAPPETAIDSVGIGALLDEAQGAQHRYLYDEAIQILEHCGLDVAPWCLARSEQELLARAGALSDPLSLKVVSRDIVHKSDCGGVRLSIEGRDQLLESYRALLRDVAERQPDAQVEAVLVQEMVPRGKEVMIGATRDPVFGPCLILGMGGVYTEVLGDYVFRLAPITAEEAKLMIEELRCGEILTGVRGEAGCHVPSIVDALLKVSQLICAHPRIQALDINPLIVDERRALVVDARAFL